MSYVTVNGKQIELLDFDSKRENFPEFFEPKPVSPKRKNILFVDPNGTVHNKKFTFKPRSDVPFQAPPSILGKRKFAQSFGEEYFDNARYGQHISNDFFEKNIGHCAYQKGEKIINKFNGYNEKELLEWCQFYLANKNLFNV